MKDPRIENLANELKLTVERLNKLTKILEKAKVTYKLPRINGEYEIAELTQKVEY